MKNPEDFFIGNSPIAQALKGQNKISATFNAISNINSSIASIGRIQSSLDKICGCYSKFDKLNNFFQRVSGTQAAIKNANILNERYFKTLELIRKTARMQNNICNSLVHFDNLNNIMMQASNVQAMHEIMISQSRIASLVEKYNPQNTTANKDEISIKEIVKTIQDENIEKQLALIKEEPSLELKITIIGTMIAILTMIATVIIGIVAHEDSKTASLNQERIISLLQENIALQEKQNKLLEENNNIQTKQLSLNEQQIKLFQELIDTTLNIKAEMADK